MSIPNNPPSPARDLVRFHKVITRALKTASEGEQKFSLGGFPSPELGQGYCDYSRSLMVLLDVHHKTEDEVVFPVFKEKIPQAPYEHLAAVHQQISGWLIEMNAAIDMINAGDEKGGLRLLGETLEKIEEAWAPHIRMEESIFSHEAIAEVMNPAEMVDLSVRSGKFSAERTLPPELLLPFVLFNMLPEDRQAFTAALPPKFMEEMIMKAWKDRWAPMKPFLLD